MNAFDLCSTYVSLAPTGSAATLEVTPDFWAKVGDRGDLDDGRLVTAFPSNADWPHWEMHPHGDELLVLLGGRMTLILDDGAREEHVELVEGRAFLVPKGQWHRALVPVPSKLLAITYGRGTKHRPI